MLKVFGGPLAAFLIFVIIAAEQDRENFERWYQDNYGDSY